MVHICGELFTTAKIMLYYKMPQKFLLRVSFLGMLVLYYSARIHTHTICIYPLFYVNSSIMYTLIFSVLFCLTIYANIILYQCVKCFFLLCYGCMLFHGMNAPLFIKPASLLKDI